MPRILDISQPVSVRTAVWPGDQAVRLVWTLARERGDAVNVAALTLSVHAGTHADGEYHVSVDGRRAAALPLDRYIGPALVIDARGHETLDTAVLRDVAPHTAQRLLFRTRERVDASAFPPRFAAISPALARALGERGVRLVGTDAPSVDPFDSKTLDAHHALAQAGIAILENLDLTNVSPGHYTLVALPLRLVEADSSPVRAVLLEDAVVPG